LMVCFEWPMRRMSFMFLHQSMSLYRVFKNVPVRLLGTRFTNAISCFEPSPQEPYSVFWNALYNIRSIKCLTDILDFWQSAVNDINS
jgi:hypothetical protein